MYISLRVNISPCVCIIVCTSHRVPVGDRSPHLNSTSPAVGVHALLFCASCQKSWLNPFVVAEPTLICCELWIFCRCDQRKIWYDGRRKWNQIYGGCNLEIQAENWGKLLPGSPSNDTDIDSRSIFCLSTPHVRMSMCLFPRYVCPSASNFISLRAFTSVCFSVL